ncbi:N-formylglutamate amidohydrolase [Legionella beliardensis]|uniref:N-formylglutamate amidohydrolase n=1 Tax=Legionella beliardensis TaxID=91822 RepID=A0A378HY22_9GAMM|nr:N-formylglutamate amidohydrolase [Legionella beliardensis]STX27798.1 N-formylglutamate amidohydrolase [Legionella beliardensis]
MREINVILSCEHAVNTIPPAYNHYFAHHEPLLNSHRGFDIGALDIASYLSNALHSPLICATVSRLLIDCNRSLKHKTCFSEISKACSLEEKNQLIQSYYLPFRQAIEQLIQTSIAKGYQVWHLSIHSFTPILNGISRNTDIGFLYDPKRAAEQRIARHWQYLLKQHDDQLQVRLNYPYRGISDGFTTSLRKKYAAEDYVGLELECKQSLTEQASALAQLNSALVATLLLLEQLYTTEKSL